MKHHLVTLTLTILIPILMHCTSAEAELMVATVSMEESEEGVFVLAMTALLPFRADRLNSNHPQ